MASSDNLITIDPDGDAIIAVSKIVNAEIKKVRFRVSRRIADALKLPRDKCEIQLAESDAASLKAMELLFRCMGASGSQDLPTEFYRLTIDEVWRVLALVDITSTQHHRPGSYNVPSRVFRKWFAAWFKRQSPELTTTDQYARLLYPAFALQELEVFASITKWLAYNDVGQIREQSLLMEAKELPSRASFLGALRGAKASLRDSLIKILDKHEQRFINADCPCRIQGLANFTKALLALYGSVRDMLDRNSLQRIWTSISVGFHYVAPVGSEGCQTCGTRIGKLVVSDVQRDIKGAFDGLCGTCMHLSIKNRERYDSFAESPSCIWHGEMTWKHSDLRPHRKI